MNRLFSFFLSVLVFSMLFLADINAVNSVDSKSEFCEILDVIQCDPLLNANGILVNEETILSAYRVYELIQSDFVSAHQKGVSVHDMISGDYYWLVYTSDKITIKVSKNEGVWGVLGYSKQSETASTSDMVDLALISASLNSKTDYICFEAPMYYTMFVLCGDDEGFLIPFGTRPDLTGLENGQFYTIEEVAEILLTTFSESNPQDTNSGGQIRDTNGNPNTSIVILVGLLFAALLASCMWFHFRRKRS